MHKIQTSYDFLSNYEKKCSYELRKVVFISATYTLGNVIYSVFIRPSLSVLSILNFGKPTFSNNRTILTIFF